MEINISRRPVQVCLRMCRGNDGIGGKDISSPAKKAARWRGMGSATRGGRRRGGGGGAGYTGGGVGPGIDAAESIVIPILALLSLSSPGLV